MKNINVLVFFLFVSVVSNADNTEKKYSIFFDFDSFALSTNNQKKIKQLTKELTNKNIIIKGFTDTIGNFDYNLILSNKRAYTLKQFLIKNGIKKTNIILTKGVGEDFTKEKFYQNRRVEIIYQLNTSLNLSSKNDTILAYKLKNIKLGEKIILNNIEFYPSSDRLKEFSFNNLDLLTNKLVKNPNLKIEIQGHICCNRCRPEVELDTSIIDLSTKRAKTVYTYLINNGVNEEQLTYRGFSSCHPLVKEINEETRQKNRRVEILIIRL